MNQSLLVTKRDGTTERINLDKIHRVLDWAAEGLNNVSISQVELRSHIQFYDGIKTSDIHETIIKAAADLISRDAPDYQYSLRVWRFSTCVKKPTASSSRRSFTIT
jgi:ribonucleoside-diphosphate reductase alpha chain